MDASHRSGNPGFVEVVNNSTLCIPNYEGNNMYNTLGNLLIYPPAGLLFIHFKTHHTLQLTGKANIYWLENPQELEDGNTNHLWTFAVAEWILLENLKDLNESFIDYSPFNTG